ncbi:MAG: restriction endonuclease, partial [Lysobacter sp.]|nr:restriction endonuclease [Lysobacter sp.]
QNVVNALLDVAAEQRAEGAILATSGEFTPSAARAAAQAKTLRLVDGAELRKMLVPLLSEEDGAMEQDPFAEPPAFADIDVALPSASKAESGTPPKRETSEATRRGKDAVPPAADAPLFDVERDGPIAAAKRRASSPSLIGRLNRPASAGPIAVAAVLLSMIVMTIVFRDRLDPYKYLVGMREPPPPAPKNESPLAGTTYKSAVFDPKVEVSKEPTPEVPFSRRPIDIPPERPPPSPDQAIKVIERSTPEVGAPVGDEARKKSDAKGK